MRSRVSVYEIVTPRSLESALDMLAREPGEWKPFAGGTDLMVLLEAGKLSHRKFLSIWELRELRRIEVMSDSVAIGALATYSEIQRDETLQREFQLLCRAAGETGSVATQNRGTLGGNIANSSPAADSPPALAVYEAELELISARGSRRVRYGEFHTGYKKMQIRNDELIGRIHVRRPEPGRRQYYRKVGTRRAQAISKVCFAGSGYMEAGRIRDLRIALGSVAPTVLRARETEKILQSGRISDALLKSAEDVLGREISPIDDMRSTAVYRRRIAQNLLADFFEMLTA